MKMTVVKNDDYDTMIQNISKYANSQNTVTDADFFSNHPFHRTLAALSTHTPAPAKDGSLHGTYWYYERSRGKYEQEQFKLYKKSDIENFKKKYPKNQVVKKEELAKYYTAAELLRPDRVSAGSQKVMKFFAGKYFVPFSGILLALFRYTDRNIRVMKMRVSMKCLPKTV